MIDSFLAMRLNKVATVLTACGIETAINTNTSVFIFCFVATVLTACGIETSLEYLYVLGHTINQLQQYLPLAVLNLE